jgi:hypothetical protein
MQNSLEDLPFKNGKLFIVDNYLEAVGVMNALRAGVSVESVRRPLKKTKVMEYRKENAIEIKAIKDVEDQQEKQQEEQRGAI